MKITREQLVKAIKTTKALGLDYYTRGGVAYCLEGNQIVVGCNPTHNPNTYPKNIEILEGTDKICRGAFSHLPVTVVKIPSTVKSIGPNAFFNTPLKEVIIPPSVKSVGQEAFMGCSSLKKVTLYEGLQQIAGKAFYKSGVTSIRIPSTVRSIGEYAFGACHSLAKVQLCEGLEIIDKGAFTGIAADSIIIPSTVRYVGRGFKKKLKTI